MGEAELAAYVLSFIIELIRRRPGLFLIIIAAGIFIYFLGPARASSSKQKVLSDEPGAAVLTFVSFSSMKDWIEDAPDLTWGIAMSSKNLTQIRVSNGELFNDPVLSVKDIDRHVIARGIKTSERITLRIKPGTYDWWIIMDHDNDGSWDSYFGSIEKEIKLNEMQFAASHKYEVIVGSDSIPRLGHVTGIDTTD